MALEQGVAAAQMTVLRGAGAAARPEAKALEVPNLPMSLLNV